MPNVAGFIRTQLDQIERWQFEGHALKDIHQRLSAICPQSLTFNAFVVSLYRARRHRRTAGDGALAHITPAPKDSKKNLDVAPQVTTQQRQGQKQMVKQIRQIFKNGADVSEFLP